MAQTTLGTKTIGSIVKLKEDGALVDYIVVQQGRPSTAYDDSCNGTWLLRKELWGTRAWDDLDTNDYANSSIQSFLNGFFLAKFDEHIQAQIKQIKIPYRPGSGTSTSVFSGEKGLSCKIFLLSMSEVGFSGINYMPIEGAKLAYFNSGNSIDTKRIAYRNSSAGTWWLRSPKTQSAAYAWYVDKNGVCDSGSSGALSIRPSLILPFALFISDDGEVNTNTAPSMPASINVPTIILRGSTITVSWSASTDEEGNLEGYIAERSTNGGGTWTQIYQGSAASATNTVPAGAETVMYRVKAYDSEGLQSDWRTSAQTIVINNHAPSAPSSLIVPEMVVCNEQLPITWGEASDTDSDLSGYILERQIDGDTWTQLYEGTALTFTDNITRGWKTVAYRVKAYDSYNAFSTYVTSETRTVNNNTAPVISGQNAALGLKTGSFSQAYTVSDAENNAVTVTEYVDNQVIRSYQAVLGQDTAITISRENWMKLTNGNHQLRVTAYDGVATTARIWTFSKKETVICFQLAAPMETEAAAVKILVSPTWKIDGAAVRVEACNNAFDEAPAWEDITAMLMLKRVYHFTNAAKTADKWGLDIRFTIEKNEGYEGEVSITGFGVAYE